MFFISFLLLPILFQRLVSVKGNIAVIEYSFREKPADSAREIISKNVKDYIKILTNLTKTYEVNMAVFPEITLDERLTTSLPELSSKLIPYHTPCLMQDTYPIFLQELSCSAIALQVTIILNLIEEKRGKFFPSDVVIDYSGQILYSNLRENQIGSTHFNHDPLSFEIPAYRMFAHGMYTGEKYFAMTSAITGFKFSTEKMFINRSDFNVNYLICSNWVSQLPFLTSLQVYQMWGHEMGATILFSGLSNPGKSLGGSGVYHGPVFMDYAPDGKSQFYVYSLANNSLLGASDLSRVNRSVDYLSMEMDNFNMRYTEEIKYYSSVLLNTTKRNSKETVCYQNPLNGKHCCQFQIRLKQPKRLPKPNFYTYHLLAYQGPHSYHTIFTPGGIEICAIVACLTKNVSSCGKRFSNYSSINWPLTFKNMTIKANFSFYGKEKIYENTQLPNSLLSSMRPIHPNWTSWSKNILADGGVSVVERSFSLLKPQDRLYTFGIFGRNFYLKTKDKTSSKGKKCLSMYILPVISMLSINFH